MHHNCQHNENVPKSAEKKKSNNVSPFPIDKRVSNLLEQSPVPVRMLQMNRQISFGPNDDELGIKDILHQQLIQQYSPQQLFPRITRTFQSQDDGTNRDFLKGPQIVKKLDFANAQRSPINIGKLHFQQSPIQMPGKISVTAKKPSIYMSPRQQVIYNDFNTEQRNRWNHNHWARQDLEQEDESFVEDLECDEEEFDVHKQHEGSVNHYNICTHCHNSIHKSPSKEDIFHTHQNSISFAEPNFLSQKKINHKEEQIKSTQHFLIRKPIPNSEKKYLSRQQQFILNTEQQKRQRNFEQFQLTIPRKKPRKTSANQITLTIQKTERKIVCNCGKTKCLKLYCDCFAAGQLCGKDCNCTGCCNNDEDNRERILAIKQILDRNPNAFRPKVQSEDESKHFKGCNCKKSNCQKKYCECYQMGVKCSDLCKCQGCKNCETPQRTKLKKSRIRHFEEVYREDVYRSKRLKIFQAS